MRLRGIVSFLPNVIEGRQQAIEANCKIDSLCRIGGSLVTKRTLAATPIARADNASLPRSWRTVLPPRLFNHGASVLDAKAGVLAACVET